MPSNDTTQQFKIDAKLLAKHWGAAISDGTSWNDFVRNVREDDEFKQANSGYWTVHADRRPKGFADAIDWAKKEYPDDSDAQQFSMAQLKITSDKLFTKCNNQLDKMEEKGYDNLPDLPEGHELRLGLKGTSTQKTSLEVFAALMGATKPASE
jgi:leucyl aminopeptidase (aminopeptidase T)